MSKSARKPVIAGNWKMNKTRNEAASLAGLVVEGVKGQKDLPDIILCPPFTSMETVIAATEGSPVHVGAQNMDWREEGAFTGEVAPPMLIDLGINYVIVGHSERRQYFGETNETVNYKVQAALRHGLIPIVCVGETDDEREANLTDSVVCRQLVAGLADLKTEDLKKIIVAYEPIWAIGTGKNCASEEANRVAKLIRSTLSNQFGKSDNAEIVPILYGGSVKPSNIEEQLAQSDIDGSLVGGASLNAKDFLAIIAAAQKKISLSLSKA